MSSPALAEPFFELVFSTPEWMHRRTERIELTGAIHCRRTVDLDFTVPPLAAPIITWAPNEERLLVPIDALAKRPINDLQTSDEEGRRFPVLSRRQNGALATAGLLTVADELLEAAGQMDTPSWVRRAAETIAQQAPDQAWRMIGRLERLAHGGNPAAEVLMADGAFADAAVLLANNFLLVALVAPPLAARRILTFSYEDPLLDPKDREERTWKEQVRESFGWAPTTWSFKVPSFSDCESYHFEATAPDGVEFIDIVLGDEARVSDDGTIDPVWQVGYAHLLQTSPGRAHLATSRTSHATARQDEFLDPTVSIAVRVERNGWLRFSALAAAFVAFFMLVSYRYMDDLERDARRRCASQTAVLSDTGGPVLTSSLPDCDQTPRISADPAALMAAVVGVVSLAVVRPGEHAYTAKLLRHLRTVAVTSSLIPLAAAWLIIFPDAGPGLVTTWFYLSVAAVLLAAVIARAWLGRHDAEGGSL